jgi:phytoene synthase
VSLVRAVSSALAGDPVSATAPRDADVCAAVVRARARTFALASYFLPPEKRRAAFALYAVCRLADDAVDGIDVADFADMGDRGAARWRLARLEEEIDGALGGRPNGAVFRELAWAIDRFGVPPGLLRELLRGVARDLTPARYATWDELATYCADVASTVGEMCTHVFGVTARPDALERALDHARTLGVAMQLTNILRDVGEDRDRGRCYLPAEDLHRFGLSVHDVMEDPAICGRAEWRGLMRLEVTRARALYRDAAPGIALLAPDSRRCATACSTGYAAILDAIEALGYDTLSTRASLGRWRRIEILWESLWGRGTLSVSPADTLSPA